MNDIKWIPGIPGEKYCPGSGTEHIYFDSLWCDRCQKDAKYRETGEGEDGCPIILAAMIYDKEEEEFPSEWCYGEDGQPKCTAFKEIKEG